MINLLSQERQKQIYREYLLRIATVACATLGFSALTFLVLLVPSYMKLTSDIDRANTEREGKRSQISADDENTIADAQMFSAEINVLRGTGSAKSIVELIERVIKLKPADVSFSDIQYSRAQDGQVSLQIKGKADTRDDLLAFRAALEAEEDIPSIDLPPQTLTKRTDIQFAITLKLSSGAAPAPAPASATPSTQEEDAALLP